jgi:hypothetical protein
MRTFMNFSRHVEFAEANCQTYSIDLLRSYLSICSEIDVVAKMLCERYHPSCHPALANRQSGPERFDPAQLAPPCRRI